MKNREKIIGSIIILLIITVFLCVGYFISRPEKRTNKDIFVDSTVEDSNSKTKVSGEGKENKSICVQIKGAVNKPGVYYLSYGSRIGDLVEKAGGFTQDADEENVILVKKLADSDFVVIKRKGENIAVGGNSPSTSSNAASGSSSTLGGKLDLNSATIEELDKLPGIGETRAKEIIRYREEHGGFNSIEDLLNISGIGEATVNKFRDLVEVR